MSRNRKLFYQQEKKKVKNKLFCDKYEFLYFLFTLINVTACFLNVWIELPICERNGHFFLFSISN